MVDRVAAAAGVLQLSHQSYMHRKQMRENDLRDRPGTSRNCLLTRLARPNSHRMSLDSVLSTEGAYCLSSVAGLLRCSGLISHHIWRAGKFPSS